MYNRVYHIREGGLGFRSFMGSQDATLNTLYLVSESSSILNTPTFSRMLECLYELVKCLTVGREGMGNTPAGISLCNETRVDKATRVL